MLVGSKKVFGPESNPPKDLKGPIRTKQAKNQAELKIMT